MAFYEFNNRLMFSRGVREKTDIDTIKQILSGCVSCVKTDEATDRGGVDYVATLRRGAEVLIDGKARDWEESRPASSFWRHGEPELALEEWSVLPQRDCPDGKVGWTLNEQTQVDMILFTFDPRDTEECYLVGFQNLRRAFRKNIHQWKRQFDCKAQQSDGWRSRCVFVPASVVLQAIVDVSKCRVFQELEATVDGFRCPICGGIAIELVRGKACPECDLFSVPRVESDA